MTRFPQLQELLHRAWRKRAFLTSRATSLWRGAGSGRALEKKAKRPVCENVKEWASTRTDVECRMLFPSRRITRNLPRTIEPHIDAQYVDRQEANQAERYLARISGARILGENGLVILPDGAYASESIYTRPLLEQDPDYYEARSRPVTTHAGAYFSLLVIWSKTGNYYHWLHDTLQRLFRVVEWLPEDVKYIVPADLRPFQRETLHLLGIEDNQLAPFSGDEIWEMENLYFAPPTTNSGSHRRDADEWVRGKILQAYEITPTVGRRRIFVTRRGMSERRLVNEQAVEEYLQHYGFETCMPETLSFRQQVELFAQAQAVISTHGSAFANLLFAPPGAVVVDMIPPSMMSWAYVFWVMCEELGHNYWYFVAKERLNEGRTDTYAPMEKLAATLDRIQLP